MCGGVWVGGVGLFFSLNSLSCVLFRFTAKLAEFLYLLVANFMCRLYTNPGFPSHGMLR